MIASAFAIPASALPPRLTMFTSLLKTSVARNASGTPSPSVSTGSVVEGSGRCTSLLKNCSDVPKSYLTPSSSMSVRSTKMSLA